VQNSDEFIVVRKGTIGNLQQVSPSGATRIAGDAAADDEMIETVKSVNE
jgi:hypothetical protein